MFDGCVADSLNLSFCKRDGSSSPVVHQLKNETETSDCALSPPASGVDSLVILCLMDVLQPSSEFPLATSFNLSFCKRDGSSKLLGLTQIQSAMSASPKPRNTFSNIAQLLIKRQ